MRNSNILLRWLGFVGNIVLCVGAAFFIPLLLNAGPTKYDVPMYIFSALWGAWHGFWIFIKRPNHQPKFNEAH